jgi:hypothetical protein
MPFPSQALKDFCSNVDDLFRAPRERTTHRDGFCECEVDRAVEYAPPAMQAQLASGLFWAVWIDQVLYYVAEKGGIPACPADRAVYQRFYTTYRFPKLYSHAGRGHASPYWLLADQRPYATPTTDLIMEDKREFWGEVDDFLEHEGHAVVKDAALTAFREDLALRFPPAFAFLF